MANPNPSPETRFEPGKSGNPSGRSSQELKNLNEAARIASDLKLKALSCLQEYASSKESPLDVIQALMNADAVRLFKEVEDRAHGTPKASTELTGPNGGPIDTRLVIERRIVDAKADEG